MSPNRPPRLSDFDYKGFLHYFLTVCVFPRRPLYADPGAGTWVRDELLRTAALKGFDISAYCVMPDHVHCLAEGTREDSDLIQFVSTWKQSTGFHWKKRTGTNLWQEGFFDHVLRDDEREVDVIRYIVENPVRAGLVQSASQYPLTGSSKYSFEHLAEAISDWSPCNKRPAARRG